MKQIFQLVLIKSTHYDDDGYPIPAEPAYFMTMFKIMFEAEGIHPLEGGVIRMKYRNDRRYGMPIEPIGVFHWKLAVENWKKIRIPFIYWKAEVTSAPLS